MDNIYVSKDGKRLGPYATDPIMQFLQMGNLTSSDLIWFKGCKDWIPISGVSNFNQSAPPPVSPAKAPQPPIIQKQVSSTNSKKKWYDRPLWVILLCLFLFPVGLYALSECYENNCLSLLEANSYLTSATRLQSEYDLSTARQLLQCKCLDDFDQYKGFLSRLKKMIDEYQSATSNCNLTFCDNLINSSNAMYNFGSSSEIGGQRDYENAKKIVENCDCWAATRGVEGEQYRKLFEKMRSMVINYEQRMAVKQHQDEIAQQQAAEEQKKVEAQTQKQAQEDSLQKAQLPQEIASLLKKPGHIEECMTKCKEYSDKFGEELDLCTSSLSKKVKTLLPSQITSQDVADVYFTPRTELPEWYMDGKMSGYIQIGGRVAWVSNDIAEMDMGSHLSFLVKFSSPWIVREGLPFMGYGKPMGNVTYRTALGGARTLPCLKLVWMYRPSLDKSNQTDDQ
jgi:hypothetical protein